MLFGEKIAARALEARRGINRQEVFDRKTYR